MIIFVASGMAGVDLIGDVFCKIVYDGAPIMFLFDKKFDFPDSMPCESPEEQGIVDEMNRHRPGDPEENWERFHEIAMRTIQRIVDSVIESDHEVQRSFLQKLSSALWIGSEEEKNKLVGRTKERTKFLAHFHDSIIAKRVLYINPTCQKSLHHLQEAINSLTPALGLGSPDIAISGGKCEKAFTFCDCCDYLQDFRGDFCSVLRGLVALLKGRNLMKDFPVSQALIEERRNEAEKLKAIRTDIIDKKNLVQYQEQFMNSSSIGVIEEEKRIALERIKKINDSIARIVSAEPFIDTVSFSGFSIFGTPKATVEYRKEAFERYIEYPDYPECVRREVESDKPPIYKVTFSTVAGKRKTDEKEEGGEIEGSLKDFIEKYAPEKIKKLIEVGFSAWEYIRRRTCSGRVEFIIPSEVHNKQLIEDKEKERDVQKRILAEKEKELEEAKEKKELLTRVESMIDDIEKQIERLKKIESFRILVKEAVDMTCFSQDDRNKSVTVMEMMGCCKNLILEFFKQKDGIMTEFLELLKYEPETVSSDVSAAYILMISYAEQIARAFPKFGEIIQQQEEGKNEGK